MGPSSMASVEKNDSLSKVTKQKVLKKKRFKYRTQSQKTR